MCYIFAQRAAQIPYPTSAVLWVQNDVYRFRSKQLVSQCGFEVGEYEAGARAALGVLDDQPKDEAAKQMLVRFKQKFRESDWTRITSTLNAAAAARINALPSSSTHAKSASPIPTAPTTVAAGGGGAPKPKSILDWLKPIRSNNAGGSGGGAGGGGAEQSSLLYTALMIAGVFVLVCVLVIVIGSRRGWIMFRFGKAKGGGGGGGLLDAGKVV